MFLEYLQIEPDIVSDSLYSVKRQQDIISAFQILSTKSTFSTLSTFSTVLEVCQQCVKMCQQSVNIVNIVNIVKKCVNIVSTVCQHCIYCVNFFFSMQTSICGFDLELKGWYSHAKVFWNQPLTDDRSCLSVVIQCKASIGANGLRMIEGQNVFIVISLCIFGKLEKTVKNLYKRRRSGV